jgi:hypothetical protein
MVLSLSPEMSYGNEEHQAQWSDMWRISSDFWDRWDKLKAQFEKCAHWSPYTGPQSWPDADMLPVGNLRLRGPFGEPGPSRFTQPEHYTLFTLWSIFRSPLMLGGHLPETDKFLFSLITNKEVLEVNQGSTNGREVFNDGETVIWLADIPGSEDHYLALFNLADNAAEITCYFKEIQLSSRWKVRDLWASKDLGVYKNGLTVGLDTHGASLFRLCK